MNRRRHLDEVPEWPQWTPSDGENQWLYFELTLDDAAPHPSSKAESSPLMEEALALHHWKTFPVCMLLLKSIFSNSSEFSSQFVIYCLSFSFILLSRTASTALLCSQSEQPLRKISGCRAAIRGLNWSSHALQILQRLPKVTTICRINTNCIVIWSSCNS